MAGTENYWWPWPSLVWPFFIGCFVNENFNPRSSVIMGIDRDEYILRRI